MATQLSTLSIILIDVAVGLGCGVAAYLLSAYTTTTIVGGATTKIVTIIPKKIEESMEKAANAATSAATDNLKNLADQQVANATTAVTNVAQEANAKANETINQELQPDIIRSTTTSEEILPLANRIDNESAPITSDIASAVAIPYTKKKPRSLKNVKSNLFLPEQVKAAQGLKAQGLAQGLKAQGLAQGLKAQGLAQGVKAQGLAQGLTEGLTAQGFTQGSKARNLAAQTLAQGEAQYKIPMQVQQGVLVGGGRKTKSKKQRKPRTKKCLITKGDKMFMSFCI